MEMLTDIFKAAADVLLSLGGILAIGCFMVLAPEVRTEIRKIRGRDDA